MKSGYIKTPFFSEKNHSEKNHRGRLEDSKGDGHCQLQDMKVSAF